jgi:hypothetical protein
LGQGDLPSRETAGHLLLSVTGTEGWFAVIASPQDKSFLLSLKTDADIRMTDPSMINGAYTLPL